MIIHLNLYDTEHWSLSAVYTYKYVITQTPNDNW